MTVKPRLIDGLVDSLDRSPDRGVRFFAYAPLIIGMLLTSVGCASLQKLKPPSGSNAAQRTRPRTYVTSVRDPSIRGEIRSELNSLRDYEQARKELRAQFEREPLPGPITLAKLEADLAAQYRAKMMEEKFAASAKKKPPAEKKASPAASAQATAAKSLPSGATANKTVNATGEPMSRAGDTRAPANAAAGTPSTPEFQVAQTPQGSAGVPGAAIEIEGMGVSNLPPQAVSAPPIDAVAGLPGSALEPGRVLTSAPEAPTTLKRLGALENSGVELSSPGETPLIFDYPVTYNTSVKRWIHFFQTSGRSSFRSWLERSSRYLPFIQYELTRAGLPQDLAYVAMIESGFSSSAVSHASAMGMWQFIAATGNRFGLRTEWWIDERKDFLKSTRAAISYMTELYQQFNSWYLVAASYNMGETGVRRLIARYRTNNFWELADRRALPEETRHYVPKIIAAMLISKAPALYGFRDLNYQMPLTYEYFNAPGGTDLVNLARYLGVSDKYMRDLNPELLRGFVPRQVKYHRIRVPKGSVSTVAEYVAMQSGN